MDSANSPGLGAARVFDQLIVAGANDPDMQLVITSLGKLETAQQVSDAVRQTLPVLTGAGAMATNNALHSMNRIIQSRIESNRGLSSGDLFYGDRQLWFKPFASRATQDDRDGVTGFKSRTKGFASGIDGALNDRIRIGGVFMYADSRVNSNISVAPQRTDVDTFELVGYGSYNVDPQTDINAQIDVGYNKNKGYRAIDFGGLRRIAQSSYGSKAVHASLGAGRTFALSEATNVTPSVRLDYTFVRNNGYTESGAGALNLRVDSANYREGLISADVKVSHMLDQHWKVVANLAAAYDVINDAAQSTSAFVGGGPAFVTQGIKPSAWIERGGIGLIKTTANGMEFTARYDAEKRTSGFLNQTASIRFRMPF